MLLPLQLNNLLETAGAPTFSGTIADISVTESTGTHDYDLSSYFVGATSYSIAPSVEAGWSFNTSTAVLTIDTDAVGTFGGYIVTAINGAGTADSNSFTVTVVEAAGAGAGRPPVFVIEFQGRQFVVDSLEDYQILLRYIEKVKEKQKQAELAEEAAEKAAAEEAEKRAAIEAIERIAEEAMLEKLQAEQELKTAQDELIRGMVERYTEQRPRTAIDIPKQRATLGARARIGKLH